MVIILKVTPSTLMMFPEMGPKAPNWIEATESVEAEGLAACCWAIVSIGMRSRSAPAITLLPKEK